MAKKQDSFYYENFSECAACACQAAHYLEDALKNFKPEGLSSMLDELHQVEHAADEKKHELSNVLARAFITPIEREDIILLSQSIDEITDKIEDVMLRLYCNNVQTIRPDAIEMGAVLIHCCEEVRKLSMRRLHTSTSDPIEIISWREIYIYMEKCADACEHVADAVESVIMKNT